MASSRDPARSVVITGLGVVSPFGVGVEPFWQGLLAGDSAVRRIASFDPGGLRSPIAGEVQGFDGKEYVRPRKALKVMAREAQLAMTAVEFARQRASLDPATLNPDRFGVVFGADRVRNPLEEVADSYRACKPTPSSPVDPWLWPTKGSDASYPLVMLKNLPNMIPCHVSIALDARGPNNTLHHAECSTLLALAETARLIERGAADLVLSGGVGSRLHPIDLIRCQRTQQMAERCEEPAAAVRPFDRERTGQAIAEAAVALVLESAAHAAARGAKVLARVRGTGAGFGRPQPAGSTTPAVHLGLVRAIRAALADAGCEPRDIGFVAAHGAGTAREDAGEAAALAQCVPGVPVMAIKGATGSPGAACGGPELAAVLMAFESGEVPFARNYAAPDPACPVDVIRDKPRRGLQPRALVVTLAPEGYACAAVVEAAG